MSKFKSGDKVKITSCSGSYWYADKIGEVFTILGPSEFGYYVTKKMVPYTMFSVKECDVELATEEYPKLEWINGIPQVGIVCKLLGDPNGIWGVAEILYISKDLCVWRWQESQVETFNRIECVSFRPLKTKEEIEREEAISEMNKDLHYFWDDDETIAGYLISKGWRKK